MIMEEVKYYPYSHIGKLANADTAEITHMLFCMQILEINNNPDTISMCGKLTASESFRKTKTELFFKYFKDVNYFQDGSEHYMLAITDEFVKFVIDRIEKVGDVYNVKFK